MNRIFRLVRNHLTQSLVALTECACGRGKRQGSGLAGCAVGATAAVAAVLATGPAAQGVLPPAQLPTGTEVVGSAGTVSTQGQARW